MVLRQAALPGAAATDGVSTMVDCGKVVVVGPSPPGVPGVSPGLSSINQTSLLRPGEGAVGKEVRG